MNSLGWIIAIVFFVVTMILFVGTVALVTKLSRRGRHPIGKDVKLLRQPGEGLRERLEVIDESSFDEIIKGLVVPSLAFLIPLLVLYWLPAGRHFWAVVALAGVAYLFSVGYRSWRLCRLITERRAYKLGLVGERAVADCLEPLKQRGYYVFHDAPAQGAKKAFNLDHIVVGPTGLFCIETKARRKNAAKDGGDDYKIGFDGGALTWPRGRDEAPVRQVLENAKWLQNWIHQRLGRRIEVTPMITIPGWYTDETLRGNLRVLSHKRLRYYIQQGPPLDAESVKLVTLQLDSLCRDVPCES